jgi:phospholipase/carboxylesterase
MTTNNNFGAPVVLERGSLDAPLVVLLHGRGSDAHDIIGLADSLPETLRYVAVRAPIKEGHGYAWFANRGIGRPVPGSLFSTVKWFRDWLDGTVEPNRPVVLVGFSGGATFAGGVMLADPSRFVGTALLCGTLPFDSDTPPAAGRLQRTHMFVAQGTRDEVIPADLQARSWDYLTGVSGAITVARRDDVGHQLAEPATDALSTWLTHITQEES